MDGPAASKTFKDAAETQGLERHENDYRDSRAAVHFQANPAS
jgi:hypothetical protein